VSFSKTGLRPYTRPLELNTIELNTINHLKIKERYDQYFVDTLHSTNTLHQQQTQF